VSTFRVGVAAGGGKIADVIGRRYDVRGKIRGPGGPTDDMVQAIAGNTPLRVSPDECVGALRVVAGDGCEDGIRAAVHHAKRAPPGLAAHAAVVVPASVAVIPDPEEPDVLMPHPATTNATPVAGRK
jgi:hypothetical protein